MSENMIRYERDDEGIVTLTMDDPGAGANTMNDTYIAAMGETVDRLEAEHGVRMGATAPDRVRAVTHLDVDDAGIDAALTAARAVLA